MASQQIIMLREPLMLPAPSSTGTRLRAFGKRDNGAMPIPALVISGHDHYTPELRDRILAKLRTPIR